MITEFVPALAAAIATPAVTLPMPLMIPVAGTNLTACPCVIASGAFFGRVKTTSSAVSSLLADHRVTSGDAANSPASKTSDPGIGR